MTRRTAKALAQQMLPNKTLTKRRAVDFCHVATAICPVAAP